MDLGLGIFAERQPSMGGTLEVTITTAADEAAEATAAARAACRRVEAWAARLTRFSDTSDLARLNQAGDEPTPVRPTLAAALRWAALAAQRSEGVVDATLLDARLAAETGELPAGSDERGWHIKAAGRGAVVERTSAFAFDLDGVAKGWLADRAADLLQTWPGVAVDADGDIALRLDPGIEWLVEIADPRTQAAPPLTTLRLRGGAGWSQSFGVATSGTSVHRWQHAGRRAHHLIDRRTRRPAQTDVVQATVVATSAREAEMIAKSAVILGSAAALDFLDRSAAHAAVLLLENDQLVAMHGIEAWLA